VVVLTVAHARSPRSPFLDLVVVDLWRSWLDRLLPVCRPMKSISPINSRSPKDLRGSPMRPG